jgi:hypothetical protein
MLMRSSLVCLSVLVLCSAMWMLSCASSAAPDRLTVHVSGNASLSILHIDTCVSSAPASEIYLDENGKGKTSLCPDASRVVELEVVAADRHYRVAPPQVQIQRTGDGIATSIEAKLTPSKPL